MDINLKMGDNSGKQALNLEYRKDIQETKTNKVNFSKPSSM